MMKTRQLLLDTNAASALIAKKHEALAAMGPHADGVLPLAVVGELLYGANNAGNPTAQLKRVREFIADTRVTVPDMETAEIYGRI
jgi:predicted nucleic acid-binding protein